MGCDRRHTLEPNVDLIKPGIYRGSDGHSALDAVHGRERDGTGAGGFVGVLILSVESDSDDGLCRLEGLHHRGHLAIAR